MALPQIPFEEMDGSPTESMSAESFSATRVFKVLWTDRLEFMKRLIGGKIGFINYITDTYPAFTAARCIRANAKPYGRISADVTSNKAKYTYALVTANYETPKYDSQVDADDNTVLPYRTELLTPRAKMISLTSESLYWSDGTELKDVSAPQQLMLQMAWVITLHEVETVPAETFSLVGKTNDAQEYSATYDRYFDAGTLLFNPPNTRPTRKADGTLSWELEYNLLYQPEGWNRFYNPNTKEFESIYKATGGAEANIVNPYPPEDFKPITEYKP